MTARRTSSAWPDAAAGLVGKWPACPTAQRRRSSVPNMRWPRRAAGAELSRGQRSGYRHSRRRRRTRSLLRDRARIFGAPMPRTVRARGDHAGGRGPLRSRRRGRAGSDPRQRGNSPGGSLQCAAADQPQGHSARHSLRERRYHTSGIHLDPVDVRRAPAPFRASPQRTKLYLWRFHVEVGRRAGLQFRPSFTTATSAKTSKVDGASLVAQIRYPKFSPGQRVEHRLREGRSPEGAALTTVDLQDACLAAVFAANPADCPAGSIVGSAVVTTPLLPVPLSGPAYFVSHGGESFLT